LDNPHREFGGSYDRRSGRDRRVAHDVDGSTNNASPRWRARFSQWSFTINMPTAVNEADIDTDRRKGVADRRSGNERRSGHDRRCGYDTRTELERFLQGERRSGLDRRSRVPGGYQTFKKARAFVRGLGLKSMRKWGDYVASGMKPDGIPAAPDKVYADDGWAGWNDWLGR
jgi:hypothetical protein